MLAGPGRELHRGAEQVVALRYRLTRTHADPHQDRVLGFGHDRLE